MASKGEKKQQKRMSAEKIVGFKRKSTNWIIAYKCGAHKKREGLPLGFVARDVLNLAETRREVKKILGDEIIKVNGIVRKDEKFNVGLFDVIDIEQKKERFIVGFDEKGRVKMHKAQFEKSVEKLSKVLRKKIVKGGKMMIGTDDGRTIASDKKEIKVGDTVLLAMPQQEIKEIVKMEPGNLVYLIGGKHVGSIAKIKEIGEGTMTRKPLVTLTKEDKEFQTRKDYCFVVGEKNPLIKVAQ